MASSKFVPHVLALRFALALIAGTAALAGATAWAAPPNHAPTTPADYSSAPILNLIAGTYSSGCVQQPGERPGGSIQVGADGVYVSGSIKGVIKHDVTLIRGKGSDGAPIVHLVASEDGTRRDFAIDSDFGGELTVSVAGLNHGTACPMPIPPQLKTSKLFSLYAQTLDIEARLMCKKKAGKGKELLFVYRLKGGVLRVFDQVYDANQDVIETVSYSTHDPSSSRKGRFEYKVTMPDLRAFTLKITKGKVTGLLTYSKNDLVYTCYGPV